jgi:hypothetical protein
LGRSFIEILCAKESEFLVLLWFFGRADAGGANTHWHISDHALQA